MKNLNVVQYFVIQDELSKALEELKKTKIFDITLLGDVEGGTKAIEEMIEKGKTDDAWRSLVCKLILSFDIER